MAVPSAYLCDWLRWRNRDGESAVIKKINLIFLCCFIFDAGALAASKESRIVDDFEDVGEPGYFVSELVPGGLIIQYFSSSLRKTFSYHVENFDD
ncbi:hypothetical protein [Burkholderia gladioli]|uniref:hypothetical protein n=1 Tax=Burkholderia gladioli TaxID=28095 RepID=UPI001641F70D|nr:hypothetical protein [Burkholderia gladioli]